MRRRCIVECEDPSDLRLDRAFLPQAHPLIEPASHSVDLALHVTEDAYGGGEAKGQTGRRRSGFIDRLSIERLLNFHGWRASWCWRGAFDGCLALGETAWSRLAQQTRITA